MTDPITIDIPHQLGRAAARAKLDQGAAQIAGVIPGGSLKSQRWEGDTLFFEVETMGQRVAARLEVFETRIHALVDLPPIAALFAGKIRDKLGQAGAKLLR
jgi:hypothetical protein